MRVLVFPGLLQLETVLQKNNKDNEKVYILSNIKLIWLFEGLSKCYINIIIAFFYAYYGNDHAA